MNTGKEFPSAYIRFPSSPSFVRRACATRPPSSDFGATSCPCGIRNAVAADVSRLKLLPRWNNERTDVRCYDWNGERDRPGCRFRRRAENPSPKLNDSTNGSGATPEPARETRALPPTIHPKVNSEKSMLQLRNSECGVRNARQVRLRRSGFREKAAI
jgi:hypothetical protein